MIKYQNVCHIGVLASALKGLGFHSALTSESLRYHFMDLVILAWSFFSTFSTVRLKTSNSSIEKWFKKSFSGAFDEFESTFHDVMTQSMIDDSKTDEKVKKTKKSEKENSKL